MNDGNGTGNGTGIARSAPNPHGKYDCPQPGCDKVGEKGYNDPRGVGVHLRVAHGIAGKSSAAVAYRERRWKPGGKNSWGRHDCPDTGCAQKGKDGLDTPQALGRHCQAKHGVPGKTAGLFQKSPMEPSEKTKALATREPIPAAAQPVIESPPPIYPDLLNYCPGCGHDLHADKQHLLPEIRANAFARCPQCKLNLAVVNAALHPEMQQIEPEHAVGILAVVRRVGARLGAHR